MLRVFDDKDSDRSTSNDDSVIPALVAQAENLDKDSWGGHLEKKLDNSNVLYGDMVWNYKYKSEDKSANAEGSIDIEPRVLEYMMFNIAQMA